MGQPGMPYEVKYGWNRPSRCVIWFSLLCCLLALIPGTSLWARIADVVLFGGGAVKFVIVSLRGTTALRVDQAGVTLCASSLYPRSTTRLFPWEDVASVVIWQGAFSRWYRMVEYVGVARRPGVPPVTGRFTGWLGKFWGRLDSSGIPPEIAVTGAVANGWVLDRGSLAAAVTQFAPWVQVIDKTRNSS